MKNTLGIVLSALVILGCAGLAYYLGEKNRDKIDALSVTIEQQKNDIEANEQKSIADIAIKQKEIDGLMGQVDSTNTVIAGLEQKQAVKDGKISTLNSALALAKTDAERVPILTGLVDEWTQKYSLAMDTIKEKDVQIVSIKLALSKQSDISESYQKLWQGEKALRLNTELKLGLTEKRMKKNKLITYGAIGASVLLVAVSK